MAQKRHTTAHPPLSWPCDLCCMCVHRRTQTEFVLRGTKVMLKRKQNKTLLVRLARRPSLRISSVFRTQLAPRRWNT